MPPSVLHTGHMPALDTCRGHVDPGGWYHWHATATDIETVVDRVRLRVDCAVHQGPDAMFGYAPQEFPNLPPCLSGLPARDNFVTTAKAGIGSRGGGGPRGRPGPGGAPGGAGRPGPNGPPPGFTEAAKTLSVSEQALMKAVQDHGGPALDVAAAARTLGVSEAVLRATPVADP